MAAILDFLSIYQKCTSIQTRETLFLTFQSKTKSFYNIIAKIMRIASIFVFRMAAILDFLSIYDNDLSSR